MLQVEFIESKGFPDLAYGGQFGVLAIPSGQVGGIGAHLPVKDLGPSAASRVGDFMRHQRAIWNNRPICFCRSPA
ncbi:MAG TPA: hypothetical protein DIC52_23775 [Candidatus Latescibacteria bacterium]|nr:hypothetical protein [Candidatus Latescibacterota bacterium]